MYSKKMRNLIVGLMVFAVLTNSFVVPSFSKQNNNHSDDSHENNDNKDDRNDHKDEDKHNENKNDDKDEHNNNHEDNSCNNDHGTPTPTPTPRPTHTPTPTPTVTPTPTPTPTSTPTPTPTDDDEPAVGGIRIADISVDKKIYNPKTKKYENDISSNGSSSHTFDDGETIKFRIVVKNNGDIKINEIRIEDIMPSILEYKDGDGDAKDDNKVIFGKFDLNPGETKTVEFSAEVNADSKDCLTNFAKAEGKRADNGNNEDSSDDADFCVSATEGSVLGATTDKEYPSTLPATGTPLAELILMGLNGAGMSLIGAGIRGFRKKL